MEKVITETFEYDNQNRLLVHKHKVDNNPEEILAQNTYNDLSRLTNKKVGGTVASSPLQSIDYLYNIRGWMTKINDPVNLNGKLFGYEIKYNNPENAGIAPGRFNGNIAEVDWNNAEENLLKRYNYEYDPLNRLKNAFYKEPTTGVDTSFDEYLSYDVNGNIMNLKRYAPQVFSTTSTKVDDLDYQYTGNRLTRITENALNNTGYEGGNNLIDYDVNGSMLNMKDKGIQGIGYNYLSLPDQFGITQKDPFGTDTNFNLSYLYRADGIKVRKTYSTGGGRGQATSYRHTDYLDGFQYSFSETVQPCLWCRTSVAYEEQAFKEPVFPGTLNPAWVLDFVNTSEGVYSFTENRYIYQYVDHLGNVRVNYAKDAQGNPEITNTNNYYAFGMNHIGGVKSMLGGYKNYKYNGKEIQESGIYDYGARFYMADIGRWGVVDPLAETSRRWSPYTYAFNNPMRFIDPDGMENKDIIKVNAEGYVQDIIPQDGPHIVQDMEGNQLNLNDSDKDQEQLQLVIDQANTMSPIDLQYNELRLFTPYSASDMSKNFNNINLGGIKNNLSNLGYLSSIPNCSLCQIPASAWYMLLLGHTQFDFAGDMSYASQKGGNYPPIQGGGSTPPDDAGGFIRFEGTDSLYNIYDAGNFITGKALQLLNFSQSEVLKGADLNSRISGYGPDTPADQNALKNGYNYNRVKWKK